MPIAYSDEDVLLHTGIDFDQSYKRLNEDLIYDCTRNRRNAIGILPDIGDTLMPSISGRLFLSPGRQCWLQFLEYAQRPINTGLLKENCFLRDCIEVTLRVAAEYCFGRDEWPLVAKSICAEYGWDYTQPFAAFVSERRSGKTIWTVCAILALALARPGTVVGWTAAFFPACDQARELIKSIGQALYGIRFTRCNKKQLEFISPHSNVASKILFFADNQQYVYFFFFCVSLSLSLSACHVSIVCVYFFDTDPFCIENKSYYSS